MCIATVLNTICVSHSLLWGDIYISCTVRLITLLMQHSFTVIPGNTNLPLSNNYTQCTVTDDIATVYTIQLLFVQNIINENFCTSTNVPIFTNQIYNITSTLNSTYCNTQCDIKTTNLSYT